MTIAKSSQIILDPARYRNVYVKFVEYRNPVEKLELLEFWGTTKFCFPKNLIFRSRIPWRLLWYSTPLHFYCIFPFCGYSSYSIRDEKRGIWFLRRGDENQYPPRCCFRASVVSKSRKVCKYLIGRTRLEIYGSLDDYLDLHGLETCSKCYPDFLSVWWHLSGRRTARVISGEKNLHDHRIISSEMLEMECALTALDR